MKEAKRTFKRLFKIIKRDEMRILPGQLAFFIVFSIIIIFTLIGLISSNYITHELVLMIENSLPSAVASILNLLWKPITKNLIL